VRNLINNPLELEAVKRVNKAAFYSQFNENLVKILNADESQYETKIGAAKDNISLCRAAIGGFVAKGELENVHEIIDYYEPWSNLMVKTAQSAALGKQQETKNIQSCNIIYLPECDENNVKKLLMEITTSVSLVDRVKDKWQNFKITSEWKEGVVIGDGGMGTALIENGLEPTPIAWLNKTDRDIVQKIHEEHIKAGAQIVLTNTLDANRGALSRYRHNEEYVEAVKELNETGVEIARLACNCAEIDVLVFGRIGPSRREEELFLPNEDRKREDVEEELYEAFKEQAHILCGAGVDGIWIEGMGYIDEAVIAVEAAKKNTDVPVICTMQFEFAGELGKIDFKTLIWRNEVSEVIQKLQNVGADMIGANCGNIIEAMPLLAHKMRKSESLSVPLVFRADARYERRKITPEMGDQHPTEEYAEIMSQVAAAGGCIVAGCCWTKPEHITAVHERLK
jgi:5-methyltetrahydrofolate--homocysteine methyltransferase